MRHSRRTTLTIDDVDGALAMKNVEVSCVFHDIFFWFLF